MPVYLRAGVASAMMNYYESRVSEADRRTMQDLHARNASEAISRVAEGQFFFCCFCFCFD